jgi:hypothetical protein
VGGTGTPKDNNSQQYNERNIMAAITILIFVSLIVLGIQFWRKS